MENFLKDISIHFESMFNIYINFLYLADIDCSNYFFGISDDNNIYTQKIENINYIFYKENILAGIANLIYLKTNNEKIIIEFFDNIFNILGFYSTNINNNKYYNFNYKGFYNQIILKDKKNI